jgi:hypothetical protein
VGDGSGEPCKEDDFALLNDWLEDSLVVHSGGIYFSGNAMAEEWEDLNGASAITFVNKWIPHQLHSGDHSIEHDYSPLVVAVDGSNICDSETTFVAFSSCPIRNNFDQIAPELHTTLEMTYGGTDQSIDGAVVSATTPNHRGVNKRVILSGFSFHNIREEAKNTPVSRFWHLHEIMEYLGNLLDEPIAVRTNVRQNSLAQNYPNPFNPTTTIKYAIKERAQVSLKIYNVAGQLVKTLVNEVQSPEEVRPVIWNGLNNDGQPVSSGVYFYKLTTKDFAKTKKMVFLK